MSRDAHAEPGVELLSPARRRRGVGTNPPTGSVVLQDQLRADEPAARLQQPPEQRRGGSEGRVGHHVVRPERQPQRRCIRAHHEHARSESTAERVETIGVQLDRDDARAHVDQCCREDAVTGTHIEDERAARQPRVVDESFSPPWIETMPAPRDV